LTDARVAEINIQFIAVSADCRDCFGIQSFMNFVMH